jgi:hypothetical protein
MVSGAFDAILLDIMRDKKEIRDNNSNMRIYKEFFAQEWRKVDL